MRGALYSARTEFSGALRLTAAGLDGGHGDERVSVVRLAPRRGEGASGGERLRELFEERLDVRGPEAEAA